MSNVFSALGKLLGKAAGGANDLLMEANYGPEYQKRADMLAKLNDIEVEGRQQDIINRKTLAENAAADRKRRRLMDVIDLGDKAGGDIEAIRPFTDDEELESTGDLIKARSTERRRVEKLRQDQQDANDFFTPSADLKVGDRVFAKGVRVPKVEYTEAGKNLRDVTAPPHITVNAGGGGESDYVESIADAIINHEQPPETKGLYKYAPLVRAALARKGFNLTTANQDWTAVNRHLATLNGPQQTRIRQAVLTAYDSLDVIDDLAKKFDGGRFPLLNKAQLAAAKSGALGAEAQQVATQLEAQINDVVSELGQVYMGGNSPTDHALGLAAKNLSADWSLPQLLSATKLARKNLEIRRGSIENASAIQSGPGGAPGGPSPIGGAGEAEYVRDPVTHKIVRKP